MNPADMIVLLASVVTIVSGVGGAMRYLQARRAKATPARYARRPASPAPYAAHPRQGAPPPGFLARALPRRGSIVWAALTMSAVPVLVYALLGVISATIVTTGARDASTLALVTFLAGAAGLLAGGIIGGKIAGDGSRALTAMLLAVILTVVGYFLYKSLTHQVVYLDVLLDSDLAANWLRAQLLLVVGAIIGGRSGRKR